MMKIKLKETRPTELTKASDVLIMNCNGDSLAVKVS